MRCNQKRSRVYKKIMRLSNSYARRLKRAVGPCVDCGAEKYIVHDHRDYSDPLNTDAVCVKCNEKRGPGLVAVIDPDTLNAVAVA